VHRDRRIAAGQQQLLTVTTPTVTLTRVQSGVGHFEVEAVCSREVGDLRLGAAYQLTTGETSTVQYAGGERFAPASARRPVLLAGRDQYEHLSIDLRQVRRLERLAVYAFSESRTPLAWGGTLVASRHSSESGSMSTATVPSAKARLSDSRTNPSSCIVTRSCAIGGRRT